MKIFGHRPHFNVRGDTIIEVMFAMTILALVMGVAYVTSRHSLQSSQQSSFRDQAAAYAQQQVELIKSLDGGGKLTGTYKASSPDFCVQQPTSTTGPVYQKVDVTTGYCTLPVGSATPSQYTLTDSYSGTYDATVCPTCTSTYTVTVKWPSDNSGSPNSVTLHYKPKDSLSDATGGFTPPTSDPTTPPPTSWFLFTSNKGNAPAVKPGDKLTLKWETTPSASCAASGSADWSGAKPGKGTQDVFPTTSTTYILDCTAPGMATASENKVVVTIKVKPTIQAFTAVQQQYGLRWSSKGPIGGMDCTQIIETSDPDTWNDNYLCAPTGNDLGLCWTSAYKPGSSCPGKICISWNEASEPASHTWGDNYLCYNSGHNLSWHTAGPDPNLYCTQIGEYSDPDTWNDNYLCEPLAVQLNWSVSDAPDPCEASGDWSGDKAVPSGSELVDSGLSASKKASFKLMCKEPGGNDVKTDDVNLNSVVTNLPPKPETGSAVHETPPGLSNSSRWDLYGTVNPNGSQVSGCWFVWDDDSSIGSDSHSTNCVSLPSGTGAAPQGVQTTVDLDSFYKGQGAGQTMHYQLCAQNANGTTCGSLKTFVST